MSEATRARRQQLLNRLEELDLELGYDRGPPPASFDVDPSWGPLGSLARLSLSPAEYDALVRQDAEIAALEHQRAEGKAVKAATQPVPLEIPATHIWVA